MPCCEARERAPGRLHRLFAERYTAFDNRVSERLLRLRVAEPLATAIATATAETQDHPIDAATRESPARWPAILRGLSLDTFFKVYRRLTYGEDNAYRSIHCQTPDGPREIHEIHEFHLEEGEFAVIAPAEGETGDSVLLRTRASWRRC